MASFVFKVCRISSFFLGFVQNLVVTIQFRIDILDRCFCSPQLFLLPLLQRRAELYCRAMNICFLKAISKHPIFSLRIFVLLTCDWMIGNWRSLRICSSGDHTQAMTLAKAMTLDSKWIQAKAATRTSGNKGGGRWLIVESGFKWMQMDENGCKWIQMDKRQWKWIKMDENEWKWFFLGCLFHLKSCLRSQAHH